MKGTGRRYAVEVIYNLPEGIRSDYTTYFETNVKRDALKLARMLDKNSTSDQGRTWKLSNDYRSNVYLARVRDVLSGEIIEHRGFTDFFRQNIGMIWVLPTMATFLLIAIAVAEFLPLVAPVFLSLILLYYFIKERIFKR